MKLPEPIDKLKDIKHAKWIGLVLTLAISIIFAWAVLYISDPFLGLYALMLGLVLIVTVLLYIFGWRNWKQLAIVGLVVIILVGMVRGPIIAHYDYNLPEPETVSSAVHVQWFTRVITELEPSDYQVNGVTYANDVGVFTYNGDVYALDNGTLTPYKSDEGVVYHFSVTLYSNGTFPQPPEVMVAYAPAVLANVEKPLMEELDPTDMNYADGKVFYYDATIDQAGVYSHTFSVNFGYGETASSLNTTVALGPIVGDEASVMGLYALIGIPSMFCSSGLMFLIVILLFWWIATAKEKRQAWDIGLEEKEKELRTELDDDDLAELKPFTCDQCGAGVGADDNFCPKCGERFDEVEDSGPEKKPDVEIVESEKPVEIEEPEKGE